MENFRFSQQRVIFIPYMEWKRKMNFFIKSATKHQLAYRYGARTGNLNFFENRSLNRGFHSLYEVEEEKFWKNVGNSWLVDSIMRKNKKLSLFCIQKHCLCRVLEQERRNSILLLILYSNRHEQLSVDVKRRKYFHFQLNIW